MGPAVVLLHGLRDAIEFPRELASLVVVPGGIGGWEYDNLPFEQTYEQMIVAAQAGDPKLAIEFMWKLEPMNAAASIPAVRESVTTMVEQYSWSHWLEEEEYCQELDPPTIERIEGISVPALAIEPKLDMGDFRRQAAFVGERVPKSQVVSVEGAGHMVNMEQPEALNKIVLSFIEQIG
jgi:pimeloyl-ACP methyl ester carboxylesterase